MVLNPSCHSSPVWCIRKLQESEEKEVLQDSPEESVLTSCSHHDMSQSYQPCEGTFLALDEQKVCSAQDVASEHSNSKGEETPLGFPGRLPILGTPQPV